MSLVEFLKTFIIIFAELTVLFIGISFLVSWIQLAIPEEKMKHILSYADGWKGYLYGTGLGALTPFCSCSTIPILAGLISAKAPFGPSMSFLIASPLLNPVMLVLMWVIFGWKWTVVYALIMFIAAMFIGMLWSGLHLEEQLKHIFVRQKESTVNQEVGPKWAQALRAAWGFYLPVLPYLFIGVLIGALIYGYVPETIVTKYAGSQNIWAIPTAAVIGIPMYIRVETLFPISEALISQGMGLGAVAALIVGGAGASVPEVLLLSKLFKRKLLFAFIISILLLAVGTGFIIQLIF